MEDIKASNGTIVTEEMLDKVCAALDSDKWPEGWRNAGDVADRLPMSPEESTKCIRPKLSSPTDQRPGLKP